MQLSDSTREVSSKHAIINKSARGYQVMDTSTNGVFINGATTALGKGNQSTLNDGDVLDIGRYRLLVSCFLPEKAKAQNINTQDMSNGLLGDDPFGSVRDPVEVELNQPVATPEPTLSARREEVVENDPFESDVVNSRSERQELNLSFIAIDDDPLAESDIQSAFPAHTSIMGSDDLISSSHSAETLSSFKEGHCLVQPPPLQARSSSNLWMAPRKRGSDTTSQHRARCTICRLQPRCAARVFSRLH